jgi:hypothetical protein
LELEEQRLALQAEEIRGNQALGWAGLSADQKKHGNRTYVNQQKQNIVALSNALYNPAKERVPVKRGAWVERPDAPGVYEWHTTTEYVTTGPSPVRNPNKLLKSLMSQLGFGANQKVLYNFAIAQIIRVYATAGIQLPRDPKKWASWWQKRQSAKPPRGSNPLRGYPR